MMADAYPRLQIIRGLPSITVEPATRDSLGRVRGRIVFRLDTGDGQENPFAEHISGEPGGCNGPMPKGFVDALKWKLEQSDTREGFDTETAHRLDFLSAGPMVEVEYPSNPPLGSLPTLFAAIADNTTCERTRSDAAFGWLHASIVADEDSFSRLPVAQQRETLLDLGGYIARTNLRKFEQAAKRGIAHSEGAKRGIEAAKQSKFARKAARNKKLDLQGKIDDVRERAPDLSHPQAARRVARDLKKDGKIISPRTVQRNTVYESQQKTPQ